MELDARFLGNWRGALYKFALELEFFLDCPVPPRNGPCGYAFDNSALNRASPYDLRVRLGAAGHADEFGFSVSTAYEVGSGAIATSFHTLSRNEFAF